MKTGKTLVELAQELQRQAAAKRDFVAPSSALTMMAQPASPIMLAIKDNSEYEVGEIAHRQIGERLKIPPVYYAPKKGEAPALLAGNVNHWLRHNGTAGEKRMIRTLDGSARAFLSDRYRPIDNYPVCEAALAALQEAAPEMRVESCEVTERRLYIKAFFPRIQGEVKRGDVVQAGVQITNSEVGLGALAVYPMSLRLVCTNGMTHAEMGTRRAHLGRHTGDSDVAREIYADDTLRADDRAFLLKVRDSVKAAASEVHFGRIVAKMQEAAGVRIEADPAKAVEVLANRYSMTQGESGGLLRHLIEGGDLSKWGVANAVTRLAADMDSYDRATELESIGGQVIELGRESWQEIAQAA